MGKYYPYKSYKETGSDWLGEIPKHWLKGKVRELVNLVNGYPFDSEGFDPVAGIPLVRIRDITRNTTEVGYTGKPEKDAEIGSGDVLVGMDGDFNVAWWEGGYALLNQRVSCLRAPDYHARRFIYYALPYPLKIINDLTYFTTVRHLSSTDIKKAAIAIPPQDELQKIVDFLDHETAKIDHLIAKQERLIELLKEKRQAVISHAVTKGLNPDAPMKDSGVEWLGEVPSHWETIRLKYLGESVIGLTYSPADIVDEGKGTLVLRASNIKDAHIVSADNVYVNADIPQKLITKEDDILICSRSGSRDLIGKNAVIDASSSGLAFGAFMTVFRSKHNQYLFHIFNSRLFEFQSAAFQTSTINQLTVAALNNMEVPLPPDDEQDAISIYITEKTEKIDLLVEKARRSIALMKEHRTALISAAVTGKIDVRDWKKPEQQHLGKAAKTATG